MSSTEQNPPAAETKQDDIGQASPFLMLFLLIPLIGILIALVMFATELQQATKSDNKDLIRPDSLLGSDAPYFELQSLEGNLISLIDFRGEILFLNFWQTTCPPCVRELPDFMNFVDEHENVAWLAINVGETPEMVRTFFAKYDFIGMPVLMDKDSEVRYQYGVIGFPVTYVLDEDGIVRHMNIGELSYSDMEAILATIQED